MLTCTDAAGARAALARDRREGRRIGLVATMGALHAGHVSLLAHARATCDVVVMSLFVNPTQFENPGDLATYPRHAERDARLAAEAGVDLLYAPAPASVYPAGFATTVSVAGPARGLEGEHRGATHFDGVATIVLKLLLTIGPDVALFGEKDAQQVAVVRRMVADLDVPCVIEARPTVRDADGLALSSRNERLDARARPRARVLSAALHALADAVAAGERDPATAGRRARELLRAAGAELDYLAVVDPVTMRPLAQIDREGLAVIAARLGDVRLIDNLPIPLPDAITHDAAATPDRAPTA